MIERGNLTCAVLGALMLGFYFGFWFHGWFLRGIRRRRRRIVLRSTPSLSKVELRAAGARPLSPEEAARLN